jgi:ribonuclease HI
MTQKKSHRRWHEKKLVGLDMPRDARRRTLVWDNTLEHDDIKMVDPDLHIYTDGSRQNDQTGCGWALCKDDAALEEKSRYLGAKATVYQAEAIAIIDALRAINVQSHKIGAGKKILIQSDSLSVLQTLEKYAVSSNIISAALDEIRTTRRHHQLSLRWVRGHDNNTGNELADYLAKTGTEQPQRGIEPEVTVSYIKGEINNRYHKEWCQQWKNSEGMRQTKMMAISPGDIKKLQYYPRKELNLILQIMTGHCLLRKHMAQWTPDVSPTCQRCNESEETPLHLLYECPALELRRREWETVRGTKYDRIMIFFQSIGALTEVADPGLGEEEEEDDDV